MRVQETKGDDVKALVAGGKEGAGVVIDELNGRRTVRSFRMIPAPHRSDSGVDFHRSDLFGSVAQPSGCIVAGTRPDNQIGLWVGMQQQRDVILTEATDLRWVYFWMRCNVGLTQIDHALIAYVVDRDHIGFARQFLAFVGTHH